MASMLSWTAAETLATIGTALEIAGNCRDCQGSAGFKPDGDHLAARLDLGRYLEVTLFPALFSISEWQTGVLQSRSVLTEN